MDEPGRQLLAGAALAHQQHAGAGRRHLAQRLQHGAERRRGSQQAALAAGLERRQPGPQGAVLGHQRGLLQRLAHALDHRLPLERLGDEVVGPLLHGGDGRLDGAVGGHQHHLDLRRHGLERAQQRLAAHPRHHQVGDHHRGALAPRHLERLGAGGGLRDAPALALEDLRPSDSRLGRSSSTIRTSGVTGPAYTASLRGARAGAAGGVAGGGGAPKAWRSSPPKTATAPPAASARKPTSSRSSTSPCREGGAGSSEGAGVTGRRCDGGPASSRRAAGPETRNGAPGGAVPVRPRGVAGATRRPAHRRPGPRRAPRRRPRPSWACRRWPWPAWRRGCRRRRPSWTGRRPARPS